MTRLLLCLLVPWLICTNGFAQNSTGDKSLALIGVLNQIAGSSVNTLATKASVKAEIGLRHEQEQQIEMLRKTVPNELKQQQPELFNDKKKAVARMSALQKALNERVAKLLTPSQLERVLQIQLQLQSYNQGLVTVFANKQLRTALDFNAEQDEAIAAFGKEHSSTISGLFRSKQPGSVRSTLDAYHAKTNPKIMALLNESQKKTWDKMVGKPFDFANNQDLPIRR